MPEGVLEKSLETSNEQGMEIYGGRFVSIKSEVDTKSETADFLPRSGI